MYDPCVSARWRTRLTPENAVFIIVSFEGPDPYSQAGGLGVRVSGLANALADGGYETHLFFIGDPELAGEERRGSRLVLHRWAQWLSAGCPRGVYDGEFGKVDDVNRALPPYVIQRVVGPALLAQKIPIFLFEEWQTAECACRVSDALRDAGLRDRALLAWNANHCYGFERIAWPRLSSSTMITTVSRHMRSIVRSCGADARVIPNGIPSTALDPAPRQETAAIRAALAARPATGAFFKMARWEREKGWAQALDAVSSVTRHERSLMLIARGGGPTGRGGELQRAASDRGLRFVSFDDERAFLGGLGDAMRDGADVVNLGFGVTPSLARALFATTDGVLANSVMEPFGLVGLEAMAAGGVAFTGGTGEDYAIAGRNAVVLETLDPDEIVARWGELADAPDDVARLRRAARKTARSYEWCSIVGRLVVVLEQLGERQGLLERRAASREIRWSWPRPRAASSKTSPTTAGDRAAAPA